MIGDPPRSNSTVQIPPWGCHPCQDPTPYDTAIAALQRYLPSNNDGDDSGGEEYDDFDVSVDAFSCDNFRMFDFKVKKCARVRSHDWTECPFAHPGEKARRRDPRRYHYSGSACPDFRKGTCRRGDACEFAHGVFECWLHPARYRTQPCKDGTHCRRRVCFFAHMPEQLRVLPYTSLDHDSFVTFPGGSCKSPAASMYSPPSSPTTISPPVSPDGTTVRLNRLTESIRHLQISKMGMGIGLSMSPPSWRVGFGSPRTPSTKPGFMSLPSTPIRTTTRPGFDSWEISCEEEPLMERVESGRAIREKIYAKLGLENSLDRVGQSESAGWVSELVK